MVCPWSVVGEYNTTSLWRGRHRSDSSGGSAMKMRKEVDGQVLTGGAFGLSLVKENEGGWGGGARSRCRR